jgi:hypothetical protein
MVAVYLCSLLIFSLPTPRMSFRRIAPALFFLRFASASLYNSLTLIVNSSQARRASSVAYLYYQVDHSIYNAFFLFSSFLFSPSVCDGSINTKQLHIPCIKLKTQAQVGYISI